MILNLVDRLLEFLKAQPYWQKIQGPITLLSLCILALVLGYQFIEWQYGISPTLSVYLTSYLVKQIIVGFIGVGGIIFFLNRFRRSALRGATNVRQNYRPSLRDSTVISVMIVSIVSLLVYLSPNNVSQIRVQFLNDKGINQNAVVYLIYELNKQQKQWFYEVVFDTFSPGILSSSEQESCSEVNTSLCYAELLARSKPLIAITSDPLGDDHFWQNKKTVSVLSTFDWEQYAPPSVYEFLIYAIIVQSIVINLNANCSGLPGPGYEPTRISTGDVFQFSPRRHAFKASILAAHLSRKGEQLLFNCFGAEYVSIYSKFLNLEWLHSEHITENLEKAFRVKL